MTALRIFVSHAHADNAFCHDLVQALRDAGADVWYDEHDMGSGRLGATIERELRARPAFIVILTPAALASQWVEDEARWFYNLFKRDPTRILLPVVAGPIAEDDLWLFLTDFKRIEAPGVTPYPAAEAIRHTLRALALTPRGEAPAPIAPQRDESADDLITRGRALQSQGKHAEALPLFERACQINPQSFEAWDNLGYTFNELKRYSEGLGACDKAIALKPNDASVWNNKGNALKELQHYTEALTAYERALQLDPNYVYAWIGKGNALYGLQRYAEALAAYEHALQLDPNYFYAWYGKGAALNGLQRYAGSLEAYEHALQLDLNYAIAWNGKGATLYGLQRYADSLEAYDRALQLDPNFAIAWNNKALTLRKLGRASEAYAAERRAKELRG